MINNAACTEPFGRLMVNRVEVAIKLLFFLRMGLESYELGKKGEEIAENYLVRQGYRIIERNFRSQQGEVDLIARDGEFLVFVEVKNYSFRSYGSPVGAIRKAKKQSLIHAAQTYLFKKNIGNTYCRFDVIAIYSKSRDRQVIEHYRDAFYIC